ncbi:MAG: energy-coupling factor transporter transmembrane protein EcfT [Clostridia bacterium]|nr:energy-coupling factor transporter transmembrane protein EcfT [Clostridia bacterium]
MLKDITIGQYYPSESVVHKLDPRLKIILTLVYIVAIFLIRNFWGFLLLAVLSILLCKVSKIPVGFLLKGLKPLAVLMVITALLNLFMTDGKILWQLGFLKITQEGIILSAFMLLRILFLVMGTSFLTYTTTPITLTSGIESLLKPFSKIGVPSHEIAMMMSIALRFIPTLIEETDKIMAAQKARGAALSEGNLIQRAKSLIPILIPLFVSAFRRADELAIAMESRCYHGGDDRTKMKELKYGKRDTIALFVFAICLTGMLMLNLLGASL